MKTYFWPLFLIVLLSCDDDEPKNSYRFKDQDLTGKVGNRSWTYSDGYVIKDDGELWITFLLDQGDKTGCDITDISGDLVWSTVQSNIGVFELVYDTQKDLTRNVVFVDDVKKEEHAALKGAIEILEISEDEVKGRIDAILNGSNYVNGNFTLPLCSN